MTEGRKKAKFGKEIEATEIRDFRRRILGWYKGYGRSFPWRDQDAVPFQQVVAEVLLQRTRAETVAGFYSEFFARYPSWSALAKARPLALETLLKPIGLWKRRASSLRMFAKAVVNLGEVLPDDRASLEALPAVGQYVASAILLFFHKKPAALLDSGVARVLERHFGSRKLADIRYDPYLQRLSERVVSSRSIEVNWALLDLAALVCKGVRPRCEECPVQSTCRFANTRSRARTASVQRLPDAVDALQR